jgi:hypothetical protein
MSEDLDARLRHEIITQQERADTDRKHGQDILDAVAARRVAPKDPILDAIERAYKDRGANQQ